MIRFSSPHKARVFSNQKVSYDSEGITIGENASVRNPYIHMSEEEFEKRSDEWKRKILYTRLIVLMLAVLLVIFLANWQEVLEGLRIMASGGFPVDKAVEEAYGSMWGVLP